MELFLASGSSVVLVGVVLWLARNLIIERLKNAVRHEYDEKLEQVRAELRGNEAALDAVRSTVLQTMASGQAVVHQRRIHAVDELWAATVALAPGRMLVEALAPVDVKALSKGSHEPNYQEFIRFLGTFGAHLTPPPKQPEAAQPFVTPMAWALYRAYSTIISLARVQVEALKAGADVLQYVKQDDVVELVKTALPDRIPLLVEHGHAAFPAALDEIAKRLIAELRATVEGRATDEETLRRADELVRRAAALQRTPSPPAHQ